MTAHADHDDNGDLALQALRLAGALRKLAEVVHDTHGRLVAGDLRRAAIAVEQTYQHLAQARGSVGERKTVRDASDGLSVNLGYPQPGGSSGGGSPRRGRR